MRRAKIVCTLGPAVNTPERIRALVDAGMDVARMNLSHGAYADHERVYSVSTQEFLGDEQGNVRALRLVDVYFEDGKLHEVEGSEREIPAELVLFAMGFTGPEQDGVVGQLEVDLDERGNVKRDGAYMSSQPGVFVAGDAGRGQSLIVWAIAEGRAAAAAVDTYLTGSTTLPAPIPPTERPLVV